MDPVTIIFPLVLFAVSIIIMTVMRSKDRKNDSMSSATRLVDECNDRMNRITETFTRDAMSAKDEIDAKIQEVKDAIITVNGQISKIQTYGNDMMRIREAMDASHAKVAGLKQICDETDERTAFIRKQIAQLETVSDIIEQNKADVEAADERLRKQFKCVYDEEDAFRARVAKNIADAENAVIDKFGVLEQEAADTVFGMRNDACVEIENRMKELEQTLQSVLSTARTYFGEFDAKIEAGNELLAKLRTAGEATKVTIPEIVIDNASQIHDIANSFSFQEEAPVEEPTVEQPLEDEEIPAAVDVQADEPVCDGNPFEEAEEEAESESMYASSEDEESDEPDGDDGIVGDEDITADDISEAIDDILEEEDENPYGDPDFGGDPDERIDVGDIDDQGPGLDFDEDDEETFEEEEIKLD